MYSDTLQKNFLVFDKENQMTFPYNTSMLLPGIFFPRGGNQTITAKYNLYTNK